jgi:hypothetical protein
MQKKNISSMIPGSWRSIGARLGIVFFVLAASQISAYGWLYDWVNLPSRSTNDPSGDQTLFGGAADILKVWATDSYNGTNYFRMDLRSAPSEQNGGQIYGIYLDTQVGGATNTLSNYVPVGLSGIDMIVDSHFDATEPAWTFFHFHTYTNDPIFSKISLTLGQHNESENGGATLEWAIPHSLIGSDGFEFFGGVSVLGYNESVYDLAGIAPVPEPCTFALALLSIGVLTVRRRCRS